MLPVLDRTAAGFSRRGFIALAASVLTTATGFMTFLGKGLRLHNPTRPGTPVPGNTRRGYIRIGEHTLFFTPEA